MSQCTHGRKMGGKLETHRSQGKIVLLEVDWDKRLWGERVPYLLSVNKTERNGTSTLCLFRHHNRVFKEENIEFN